MLTHTGVAPVITGAGAGLMVRVTGVRVRLATTVLPVAASYQTTVDPAGAVAVAVRVCIGDSSQANTLLAVGAAGAGLMVRVTAVRVRLVHPPAVTTDSA